MTTSAPAMPPDSTARELFENLPHGVVVHQLGRILYVNPAMLKLLGRERAEELIGSLALEPGRHTVSVTNLATRGRSVVAIDALAFGG